MGSLEVRLPESQFYLKLVTKESKEPDKFRRMIGSELGPRPTQD